MPRPGTLIYYRERTLWKSRSKSNCLCSSITGYVYWLVVKVLQAFLRAAIGVAFGVFLLVVIQRLLGWRPISGDPSSVSSYLTALAQFAAIPVTLALGILVLVIQLQAGMLTSRAGAVVLNSPEFLRTVALLFLAPAFSILLLGVFDLGQGQISDCARELAFGALVPVVLTLRALIKFTNTWFRLVSPAAFTGLILGQAVQGLREKNRDTVALAVRGLGEIHDQPVRFDRLRWRAAVCRADR
jgi:hypothetical protein